MTGVETGKTRNRTERSVKSRASECAAGWFHCVDMVVGGGGVGALCAGQSVAQWVKLSGIEAKNEGQVRAAVEA